MNKVAELAQALIVRGAELAEARARENEAVWERRTIAEDVRRLERALIVETREASWREYVGIPEIPGEVIKEITKDIKL